MNEIILCSAINFNGTLYVVIDMVIAMMLLKN